MEPSRAPLRVFFDTSALTAGSHARTGAAFALLQLVGLAVVRPAELIVAIPAWLAELGESRGPRPPAGRSGKP